MLNDAITSLCTFATEILRNGNAERCFVGLYTRGSGCESGPVSQLFDNRVARRVDDGNVGSSGVGRGNVKGKWDDLSSGIALHLVRVVGEFVALAEPDLALGGVVVALRRGDLEHALDVSVVVRGLVHFDLLATGGCHGGSWNTGCGSEDTTVG